MRSECRTNPHRIFAMLCCENIVRSVSADWLRNHGFDWLLSTSVLVGLADVDNEWNMLP